jgi:hypothetical protein
VVKEFETLWLHEHGLPYGGLAPIILARLLDQSHRARFSISPCALIAIATVVFGCAG